DGQASHDQQNSSHEHRPLDKRSVDELTPLFPPSHCGHLVIQCTSCKPLAGTGLDRLATARRARGNSEHRRTSAGRGLMGATVATVAYLGLEARSIEVQVQLSTGLPAFIIVGLPDKAVAESRERVRAALAA